MKVLCRHWVLTWRTWDCLACSRFYQTGFKNIIIFNDKIVKKKLYFCLLFNKICSCWTLDTVCSYTWYHEAGADKLLCLSVSWGSHNYSCEHPAPGEWCQECRRLAPGQLLPRSEEFQPSRVEFFKEIIDFNNNSATYYRRVQNRLT